MSFMPMASKNFAALNVLQVPSYGQKSLFVYVKPGPRLLVPRSSTNAKLFLHSDFTCAQSYLTLGHRNAVKDSKMRIRVVAEKLDVSKVLRTIWKVGSDSLKAGTKLVPESVPRPAAQVGVAVVGLVVISFVLRSVLSTALFILAIMGIIYFLFIYLNKDEGPRGGSGGGDRSMDETLDEARRIMEKYK